MDPAFPVLSRRIAFGATLLLAARVALPNHASQANGDIRTLHAVLGQPASALTLSLVKLSIDKLIDRQASLPLALRQLDNLAKAASSMVGSFLSSAEERVAVIGRLIYQAGAWNDGRPFRYDLERDPEGTRILEIALLPPLSAHRGRARIGQIGALGAHV